MKAQSVVMVYCYVFKMPYCRVVRKGMDAVISAVETREKGLDAFTALEGKACCIEEKLSGSI